MRLLIAGSRKIKISILDIEKVVKDLGIKPIVVISGHAPGVDRIGEAYAKLHNICLWKLPAPWRALDKPAGHFRNASMAKICDQAIIFWDGKSPGTTGMIKFLKKEKVPHRIIRI